MVHKLYKPAPVGISEKDTEQEQKDQGNRLRNLFVYEPSEKMAFDDGFLRNRAVAELSAIMIQAVVGWLKENNLNNLQFQDLDAAFDLMKLIAAREKGGKVLPPNY